MHTLCIGLPEFKDRTVGQITVPVQHAPPQNNRRTGRLINDTGINTRQILKRCVCKVHREIRPAGVFMRRREGYLANALSWRLLHRHWFVLHIKRVQMSNRTEPKMTKASNHDVYFVPGLILLSCAIPQASPPI